MVALSCFCCCCCCTLLLSAPLRVRGIFAPSIVSVLQRWPLTPALLAACTVVDLGIEAISVPTVILKSQWREEKQSNEYVYPCFLVNLVSVKPQDAKTGRTKTIHMLDLLLRESILKTGGIMTMKKKTNKKKTVGSTWFRDRSSTCLVYISTKTASRELCWASYFQNAIYLK